MDEASPHAGRLPARPRVRAPQRAPDGGAHVSRQYLAHVAPPRGRAPRLRALLRHPGTGAGGPGGRADGIVFAGRGATVRMTNRRNVIVHIATSADGYIARPDGDLEWLTPRATPARC